MKDYIKGHQPHFKDQDLQEFSDFINRQYPMKITEHEDLIERIYSRYPYISKGEVAIIVKTVFEGIRHFLIIGKNLHFKKIANVFRFVYTFRDSKQFGFYPYLYAKIERKIK